MSGQLQCRAASLQNYVTKKIFKIKSPEVAKISTAYDYYVLYLQLLDRNWENMETVPLRLCCLNC